MLMSVYRYDLGFMYLSDMGGLKLGESDLCDLAAALPFAVLALLRLLLTSHYIYPTPLSLLC